MTVTAAPIVTLARPNTETLPPRPARFARYYARPPCSWAGACG